MTLDNGFRRNLLDALNDPDFAHQVWESIRVVAHQREMDRMHRWVQKRREEYDARPWWQRAFIPRPL